MAAVASADEINPHTVLQLPGSLMVAAYGGGAAMSTARTIFSGHIDISSIPDGILESATVSSIREAARLDAIPADDRVVPHRDVAALLKPAPGETGSVSSLGGADISWSAHVVVSSLPYGVEEAISPPMPTESHPSATATSPWIRANMFHHGWALSRAAGWDIGAAGAERGAGVWLLVALAVDTNLEASSVAGTLSSDAASLGGSDPVPVVCLGRWCPCATMPATGYPVDDPSWLCVAPADTAAPRTSSAAAPGRDAPSSAPAGGDGTSTGLSKRQRRRSATCGLVLTGLQPCDTHCHAVQASSQEAVGNAASIRAMMLADGASESSIAAVLDATGLGEEPGALEWHIGGDTGKIALPVSSVAAVWVLAIDGSTTGNVEATRQPRGLATLLITVPGALEAGSETKVAEALASGPRDRGRAVAERLLTACSTLLAGE